MKVNQKCAVKNEEIENEETVEDIQNEAPEETPSEGSIVEMGSITTNGKHLIHCLTIIGQVEGHFILPAQNSTNIHR